MIALLPEPSVPSRIRRVLLALVVTASACGELGRATDLRLLVARDGTYYDPESQEPFTGRVFRTFPGDSTRNEIVGALVDGTWHGELTVYHPSGRIRYMGSFDHGARCGPWTENQDDHDQETSFRRLVSDIESMAIYPPCSSDD